MAHKGVPANHLKVLLRVETDECILWPYAQDHMGYGLVWHDGKTQRVHRVALKIRIGEPTKKNKYALHTPLMCHNRLCLNYRHLRWGTPADNTKDSFIDGTFAIGERSGFSKISDEKRIIIALDNRKVKDIAIHYGVSESSVVVYRRKYRSLNNDNGLILKERI